VTFLALDGLDGTGKSTQCRLLADWLRQHDRDVVTCIDPGGTPLGQEIREILLSRRHTLASLAEALLFMASRAQLIEEVIRPALNAGKLVLSDRYLLANVVYQGHAGGLAPELLWQLGRAAAGGLEPDLTLVLDIDPAVAVARRRHRDADRFESRPADYHDRVRRGFLTEAERAPERIKVINASGDMAHVQKLIRGEVGRFLKITP
jgi:dTMP kinase